MTTAAPAGGSAAPKAAGREKPVPAWLYLVFAATLAAATYSHLPALSAPVALDDFEQRALIEGQITPRRAAWNLFDFVDNDNRAALLERGAIPWWTYVPDQLVRFLRPLPSMLVWADYRLAGYDGFVPHVISFVWWIAAVVGAYALFRQLFGQRAALICSAVFAVSPAHTVPIVWLANRGVLVTLAIGSWALAYYVRWRDSSKIKAGLLSLGLWTATLLTGEYALCFAGYVLVIEIARRGEVIASRVRGLMPFLLPLILYIGIRSALGYTVRGSFFYKNPFENLGEYLVDAPRAIAVLVGSVWFGIDDRGTMSASPQTLIAAAMLLAAVSFAAIGAAFRSLPAEKRTAATWLVLGSLAALVPVLSTRASMRVLGPAAIGASAGVGVILNAASIALDTRARRKNRRRPGVFVILTALVLAYLHFIEVPRAAHSFTKLAAEKAPEFAARLEWVREHLSSSVVTVVVLRAVTPPTAFVAPFMLREAAPKRWRVLSQAFGRIAVVRSGARTLDVTQDGNEPLVHFGVGEPVRAVPFHQGEVVEVPGMRATIQALDPDGLPTRLQFEFDRDLDDPSFLWIVEGVRGFSEVALPQVGYGVLLAP